MTDTEVSPAVEAWASGDLQKAQELNQPIPDDAPAGAVPQAVDFVVAPKTEAPTGDAALMQRAATTLAELGPEGQALVQEWGGHTSPDFQANFAYARAAFADVAKNRPDLIAKVDASGLGNDPAVLKILSELGRQKAHTMRDFTVEQSRMPSTYEQPAIPRGQSARQTEINKIMKDNPPGSEGYRDPAVQRRLQQLHGAVGQAGDQPMIGRGGRTA